MPLDLHALNGGGRRPEPVPPVNIPVNVNPPDPNLPGPASTVDMIAALPRRRYRPDKGALYVTMDGLIVTPLHEDDTYWTCRVITGNTTYPSGGYDIVMSNGELCAATEIRLHLTRPDSTGGAHP